MNDFNVLFQDVKRVEIVIDSFHTKDVIDILEQVQVSGYTLIEDTLGKGDRGVSCSDIDCVFSGQFILTVCTNERQLNTLVEKLKPLLKKVGGVCLITDAKWVSH